MTDVEAPAPAVTGTNDAEKNTNFPNESEAVQNGEVKSATRDAEKDRQGLGKSMFVHSQDRQDNESARVREAKRWNERDRHKYDRNNTNNKYDNKYRNPQPHDGFKPKKFQSNSKYNAEDLPETDDPVAIRKQVEFYFSDSNLLTDKFLFTKIEGHINTPVSIDVIHSFKRMRHFQPRSALVSALKESATLILVNDENDIQRKAPLPEGLTGKPIDEIQKVHEDESMARSIYAKGFGKEEASTQFDIEAFFANYGTTNSVRLRRGYDRGFKGSVFVEFDNEETAKTFAAIDPPPAYKGNELLIKTKKQYCDDKVEDIKAGRIRPHSPDGGNRRGGFSSSRRGNDHRDLDKNDDRDWRLRRQQDAREGFPDRDKGDNRDRRGGVYRGSGRGRGGRGRGRDRDRGGDRGSRDERPARDEASPKETDSTDQQTEKPARGDADRANASDAPKGAESEQSAAKKDFPEANGADKMPSEPTKQDTAGLDTTKDAVGEQESEGASKKRQREADDTTEDAPKAKKVAE